MNQSLGIARIFRSSNIFPWAVKWRSHSHQSPARAYWRRFGYPLATTLKNAQQRATMAAKEERARDAALAMQEYVAEKLAIGIKTARLRALRLAKEAESN